MEGDGGFLLEGFSNWGGLRFYSLIRVVLNVPLILVIFTLDELAGPLSLPLLAP